MSAPTDFVVTDADDVPNHRVGEPIAAEPKTKPGIFGTRKTRTAKSTSDTPSKPAPPNKPGQFIEPIEDIYSFIGMTLMPFKPMMAGYLLMPEMTVVNDEPVEGPTGARRIAEAWDEVAQKNESVRRVLAGATTAGVWGKLIAAHMPLAVMAFMETDKPMNPNEAMAAFAKRATEKESE